MRSIPSITLSTLATASVVLCNASPPLQPNNTLNCNNYPELDTPVPEVPEWTALYDLTLVPPIAPNIYKEHEPRNYNTDNADGYIDEERTREEICKQHLPDACNAECGCRRDEIYGCRKKRRWALTYDWGPTRFTPELVEILKNTGDVKGTFFVVGSRLCDENALEIINAVNAGHEIGISTWSYYTRLTSLSNGQIIAEIKSTENAVFELTGIKPKYFRPPAENMDDRVRFIIKAMGYTPIMWTPEANTLDWRYVLKHPRFDLAEGTDFITGNIAKYISSVNGKRPGTISLQHNLGEILTSASEGVIKKVRDAGWKFVPMTTCVEDTSTWYREVLDKAKAALPWWVPRWG